MKLPLLRAVLAPRTSWQAWRVVRASGGTVSFDAAWRSARVQLHPDEAGYRAAGHDSPQPPTEDAADKPTTTA
ncbi:hypothetical protein SGR_7027t [Streptomyces griseus subsp. griseus NBRC 13350]|uniref:Uncharacterized protein n=1 Tax=Streptomyces griseus subsp. griseus (strain JCM 4626 / CBS 651.72 / NBRC 13350 / KCC S-0626 / ISP 5235) TaxID=455632 RepID=B1VNB8_STRGG|nr:hypothetical protein SGR_112t [Streptomyces griseus subsp. griseus NBRC 13350]BAG23854.1 hypothetical protein SGR_7027t [Streptomyces griseus subsp. griseus NBRC 13350]